MKNIKKALLLGVAFLGVGAITACNGNNNNNGQQQVENDATTAVNKILLTQDKGIVTANFEVTSTVKYNGTSYNVTWKSNKDVISFATEGGKTICKVNYTSNTAAEQKVVLTATVTIGDNIANRDFEVTVPKFVVTSIAELDAADKGNYTVRGVIVTKEAYNATAKTTNVYCQAVDGNGGFEAYTLSCTQEQYDTDLVVGNTIYVSGPKSYYNGLRELSGCTYILDSNEAKKTITAEDLTATVAAGTFTNDLSKQCHLATLEDVEIVSISAPDATGQYSIIVGDDTDKTKQATVRISKYFFAGKTATDYAFKSLGLVPAQKITVTGLVGWYNGAQLTPLADTDIEAGDVNYGKAVALTAANDLAASAGSKCIPNKVITLKTTLKDLGLTDTHYTGYTVTYSTESTVASIAGGKLTNTKPAADTDVTVTVTVKDASNNVVATKNVTYKLLKEVTYTTHANYVKAKDKAEINVKGFVLETSADKKTVFLQDADGNTFYCYLSTALTATQATPGYSLGVTGVMTTYNGLRELGSAAVVEDFGQTNQALIYEAYTEEFTANGYTALEAADQCKAVKFEGTVKSIDGRTIVVTVGQKDINVYLNNTSIQLTYPAVGDTVEVFGLLGLYEKGETKTFQVLVNNADNFVVKVTDEVKATRELAALVALVGTDKIEEEKTIKFATRFAGVTFTVTPATGATTLAYDATKKELKVTPGANEVTEKVTIAVTVGEATKTQEVDVVSKELLPTYTITNAVEAEVKMPNATVANFGLPTTDFTFTYVKQDGSAEGTIRTDEFRLYGEKGKATGNKLTFTMTATGKKITKIKIQFSSANDGKAAKILDKDGKEIKANEDGSYTINGTVFTILDDNTGLTSNTQVRFKSIKIYCVDVQ